MKKLKLKSRLKFIIAISLLFGCVLLVLCCQPKRQSVSALNVGEEVVVEDTTNTIDKEEFDWAVWFKEKALPVLVAVGSGIMTICAVLVPVLKSVKGGINLFKNSKAEYDKTTTEVLSAQKEINKTVENVQDLKKEVAELKIQVVNLVKIVKIAFTNNIELVKNGYANEILKIGDENGSKEIKETNSTTDNV